MIKVCIRKELLILLVTIIVLTPAAASGTEWVWFFKSSDANDNYGAPGGYIGTTNSDVDGYQSTRDKYLDLAMISGMAAYGVRHVNGEDSWTGPTGYYRQDLRAPLSSSKTWRKFYVWAMSGFSASQIKLAWTPGMNGSYMPSPTITYTLKMVSNAGVPGAPSVGTTWTLNPSSGGYILLPTVIAPEGSGGYELEFSASLPEPGSLAALIPGLCGISLHRMLRRRK